MPRHVDVTVTRDADDVFGPVVVRATTDEALTIQIGEDPGHIQEIQRRLRGETKNYQTLVAKRQFR